MSTAACPHCGASNPITSGFCQACGKALPGGVAGSPRIVTAETAGATPVGRELLGDELKKQMKKASGALLAVAIIQAVMGPVMLFMMKSQMEKQTGGPVEIKPIAYVIVFGIAAAFFALWAWSRVNPFAAAVVGLVLFISLHLLEAISDPTSIVKGILLKIIIIAVLVQAIGAGAKYRKLQQQQRMETGRL